MATFLENVGKILMGVASLLPTFLPSWNDHFWSYPSFHCIFLLEEHKFYKVAFQIRLKGKKTYQIVEAQEFKNNFPNPRV